MRKRPIPKPKSKPGQVWSAWDDAINHVGFLVAERGNADRLIAFVPCRISGAERERHDERESRLMLARAIADDQGEITCASDVTDLRGFGQLDSPHPTPAAIYGWRLTAPNVADPLTEARPCPFCRFRFARMLGAALRMTEWQDWGVEQEKFTTPVIGLRHEDIGDGGNITVPVEVALADVPLG